MLQLIALAVVILLLPVIFRAAAKYIFGCLAVLALLGGVVWLLFEYTKITLVSAGAIFSALLVIHFTMVVVARSQVVRLMQEGYVEEACRGLAGRQLEVKKQVFEWLQGKRGEFPWVEEFLSSFLRVDASTRMEILLKAGTNRHGQSEFPKESIDKYVEETWGKLCEAWELEAALNEAIERLGLHVFDKMEGKGKICLLMGEGPSEEISLD